MHPASPFKALFAALSLGWLPAVAASAGSLILTQAIIHPVNGPALTNAAVFISDGRITAVGPVPPSGAAADTIIELNGLHLYPGLIATDTLLGLNEIDSIRATRDAAEVGEFRPDVHAWVAIQPDSELIPVARANGYTHVQSVPQGGVLSGYSTVIKLDGWTIEDLAIRKLSALHVFWPDFTLDVTPKEAHANPESWKSPEDQVRARNRRLREIEDFFRDAESYARARRAILGDVAPIPTPGTAGNRPPIRSGFTLVPAWEAMLPALRGEVPIFLHADEARQIRSAVEWAVSRKLQAVLVGGRDAGRVADLLARHKIPVAFEDLYTLPGRDTDAYDAQFTTPAVLAKAGVKVTFGGGADRFGSSNLRNIPYAAGQAVGYGLSPEEALKGLTLYPAEILGLSDRLGTLEAGKEATLFAADGDILDIRTRVRRLWIAGKEISLESRHTRLYDRYRNRPAPR